jgi:hypothetical protein
MGKWVVVQANHSLAVASHAAVPRGNQPDKSAVAGRLTLLCCSPDGARNFGSAPFLLQYCLVNFIRYLCIYISFTNHGDCNHKLKLKLVFIRHFSAAIGRVDGEEL